MSDKKERPTPAAMQIGVGFCPYLSAALSMFRINKPLSIFHKSFFRSIGIRQNKRSWKKTIFSVDLRIFPYYSKGTINARRVLRGQTFIKTKLSRERRDVNTEKIKELREKAGITQAELARRLGVTRAAVLFMESEGNYPQAWRLPEIANVIGCSVDALFGREGRP